MQVPSCILDVGDEIGLYGISDIEQRRKSWTHDA